MKRTDELARRDFLLRVAALTATTAGLSLVATSRAQAVPATSAWALNPNWGYPLGAHGRTSCHCHACPPHAANMLFADQAAATSGRAHVGCLCQPNAMNIPPETYRALFTAGVSSVDRRDPLVAALLAQAPPSTAPNVPTPRIIAFTPRKGRIGERVVITGVGLAAVGAIRFGQIAASEQALVSDTQISTSVPLGATTGAISLQLPGATLNSSARFVVLHQRRISFAVTGDSGSGIVRPTDGLLASGSGVPVKLQHLEREEWRTVASVRTALDGSYRFNELSRTGTYRAVATRAVLPSGDVCLKAVSKSRTT